MVLHLFYNFLEVHDITYIIDWYADFLIRTLFYFFIIILLISFIIYYFLTYGK